MLAVVNNNVPRLLAPAGSPTEFFAALNAGADAVYLGLNRFSARSRATNFTFTELAQCLTLAREYQLEVLVAINTLLFPSELTDLTNVLADLVSFEPAGVIVQDLGVATLIRESFPTLRLHASTQMAIHNLSGAIAAREMGFRRVVLARELSTSEIVTIRQTLPAEQLELEVFCHGSLCYSYSGLCQLGWHTAGLSGNRGECPYPCRRQYASPLGVSSWLNMRDLETLDSLASLVKTGVDVLKIEGRRKDAQYVTTTLLAYRQALNQIVGRNTLRESAPPLAHEVQHDNRLGREALGFGFRRKTTPLYLEDTPVPVQDQTGTTHTGCLIGVVEQIDSKTHSLTLRTIIPIEKYDGIRIGEEDFSLRNMSVNGKTVATAAAQIKVVITLPPSCQIPKIGAEVSKTRSATLRGLVDRLARPPGRLRALRPFTLHACLQENTLAVTAYQGTHSLLHQEMTVSRLDSGASWCDLAPTIWHVFGDAGCECTAVTCSGDIAASVPQAQLKQSKRALSELLPQALDSHRESIRVNAQQLIPASRVVPLAMSQLALLVRNSADIPCWRDFLDKKTPEIPLTEILWDPQHTPVNFWHQELLNILTAASQLHAQPRLVIPLIIRGDESKAIAELLTEAFHHGMQRFEVTNLAGLSLLRNSDMPLDLTAGQHLHLCNPLTALFLKKMGFSRGVVSNELPPTELTTLCQHLPEDFACELVGWSRPLVCVSEACANRGLTADCTAKGNCLRPQEEILTDKETGQSYRACREGCRTYLYANTPQDNLRAINKSKVSWIRIDGLGGRP